MTVSQLLTIGLSIFLYGLLSYYIAHNGWKWLEAAKIPIKKRWYGLLILVLTFSYLIGRGTSSYYFELAGAYWFIVIGYSLLLLPAANLVVWFFKKQKNDMFIYWTGITVIGVYLFIFLYGSYNAWSPITRTYEIQIQKPSPYRELQVLMVSDLHLGPIVGINHLKRLTKLSESIQPDIILIPGDIIDDNLAPFVKQEMGSELGKLTAPLGVFAVLGNHEYYGDDLDEIIEEMEDIEIRMLLDESELIEDSFYLSGRKDLTDPERLSVDELVDGLDETLPIIMLDHQPVEIEEAMKGGVDVLLSGHTHKGQAAPANLITDMLYENDWGYLQKGNLHSFVSSGFGTWGPPIRIGSRAEVMVINISFN
ncbi:metallophosphoesterase [Jeotgalibacillus sp. ET6]|uniref:metallophosphoesterase n=1 Tax=Jeotgalibacillus sp. ET6 TaxID=3037260 RepID=UPI002418AAEC|nr:metallophosphoesterase [Jeotgalibacillus sp. ET6]MDG5470461.1 metallophosphoesterase [Jeotgalibacillus sp. ET6]